MNEKSPDGELIRKQHPLLKKFIKGYVMENGSYNQVEILRAYNKMRSEQNLSSGSSSTVSRDMHELSDNNGGFDEYFKELIAEGRRNNKHKLVDQGLVELYPDVQLTLVKTKDYMAEQVSDGIQANCKESVSIAFSQKNYVLIASQGDEAKKKLCAYLDERLRKRNSGV